MKTYSVSEAKKKNSIISEEDFNTEYQESINNPESFWQKKAEETLDWFSNWDEVAAFDMEAGEVAWFKTGKLNASGACEILCTFFQFYSVSEEVLFTHPGMCIGLETSPICH